MANPPSSIFNDVIGPVMIGPSSSHTAGPARIGFLAAQFAPEGLAGAHVCFETQGSFAATYRGQKSDQGFTAGFLGLMPHDARLPRALTLAKAAGVDVSFSIKDFAADHPNTALIELTGVNGVVTTVRGLSLGGGRVVISAVNGCKVEMRGDFYELIIMLNHEDQPAAPSLLAAVGRFLEENCVVLHGSRLSTTERDMPWRGLLHFHMRQPLADALLVRLRQLHPDKRICQIAPVMPVLASDAVSVPFINAREMLAWCATNNAPLWEAAVSYEADRGGIGRDEVLCMMEAIAEHMQGAIAEGLAGNFEMRGFLTPSAKQLALAVREGRFIPSGILDSATVISTAVMELNAGMGCIVAAPTAGSCGILPAAVFSALHAMNVAEASKKSVAAKALLAAGLIGVFISEQATFAAEVCGCQAECGSAACMAAAALAEMFGANAATSCHAAALALQNSLGLICDPVAEQVEIPCISRNAAALGNAVTAANMAMFGFRGALPLDEVIQAMWEVGNALPETLRCTGKGGLCVTPSGREIKALVARRQAEKDCNGCKGNT